MKYIEPTIVTKFRADSAIQGLDKPGGSADGAGLPTDNVAYRADE